MPRSQRNDNFIDKTFTIVADILLRIIPMAPEEKEAFTYYRDGVIWYFFRSSFFGEKRHSGIKIGWIKTYAQWRWVLEIEQFLLSCIPGQCSLRCSNLLRILVPSERLHLCNRPCFYSWTYLIGAHEGRKHYVWKSTTQKLRYSP